MAKTQNTANQKASKPKSKNKPDQDHLQMKIQFAARPPKTASEKCEMCQDPGSLIACRKCMRAYHLTCYRLNENLVSFTNWVCVECLESYDRQLDKEAKYHLSTQRDEKDRNSISLLNKIREIEVSTPIKKFASKYPQYIKGDKIAYPLPDYILWENPELHSLESRDFPSPQISNIDAEVLGKILFVCDFINTFTDLLETDPIGYDDLYRALDTNYETKVSKEIHIALLRHLAMQLLRKENADKNTYRGLNNLLIRAQKFVDFDEILDTSYLVLLDNVICSPLWKEIVESSGIESNESLRLYSIPQHYYGHYTICDKLEILGLVILMLLDSLTFYQEITDRAESLSNLYKEKFEISTQLRALKKSNTTKVPTSDVINLEKKHDQVLKDIKSIKTRTECLGRDREYNEYFVFSWDQKFLFVKSLKNIIGDQKESDSGYWYFYDSQTEVENLIKFLCLKGEKEAKLKIMLTNVINDLTFEKAENEDSNVMIQRNIQNDSQNIKDITYKFSDLKIKLKQLYQDMNINLGVLDSEIETLLREDEENLPQIIKILEMLSDSTGSEQVSQEIEGAPSKYRKCSIKLWDDLGDLQSL